MKRTLYQSVTVYALLVLGLAVVLAACAFGGNAETPTTFPVTTQPTSTTPSLSDMGLSSPGSGADALSTFKSKDPFIPQALPPASSSTTISPIPSSTTTLFGTSTTFRITTTTRPGTSTSTTRPTSTTTTTVAHLHSLKILSISTVSGVAVVTFRVDSTTYKDKRAGDVVSTTWGQVKVVDINTSSKVVTLLHGSETLILGVGQSTFE